MEFGFTGFPLKTQKERRESCYQIKNHEKSGSTTLLATSVDSWQEVTLQKKQ